MLEISRVWNACNTSEQRLLACVIQSQEGLIVSVKSEVLGNGLQQILQLGQIFVGINNSGKVIRNAQTGFDAIDNTIGGFLGGKNSYAVHSCKHAQSPPPPIDQHLYFQRQSVKDNNLLTVFVLATLSN